MDSPNAHVDFVFLVYVFVVLLIYFLPAVAAKNNKHPQTMAIFLLNLLAGWTFIGWVAALVWAVTRPSVITTRLNK